MFRVGEHVMYRNIGICEVEAIGKIGFSSDKEKEYYTLRPLCATNNSRFYVPVGASASMRNIISRQEAYQYLAELESMQTKPFCAAKQTRLTAHYDELLTKYDVTDHLILFKELCQKEKKVKEGGKKFGQRESVYKNQVEKLLIDEFAYALDETPGASKERLYKALIIC